MSAILRQTWDLETLFPGGSDSGKLAATARAVEEDLRALTEPSGWRTPSAGGQEALAARITALQSVYARLEEASSFVGCLLAQDVEDQKAKIWNGRVSELGALAATALSYLEQRLAELGDGEWERLLSEPGMREVSFALAETRTRAREKMPLEKEILVNDLSVDGYHAWSDMYDTVVGRMKIAVTKDGETRELSVGQADNALQDADRTYRAHAFEQWEGAWAREAELCAGILNHIAGFRLQVYGARGWRSVLKEPLEYNRMTEATLTAMWDAVLRNKERLVPYLQRKAKLFGVDRLDWHDVEAPLGETGRKFSYEEARAFIVRHFRAFSGDLAEFSDRCFERAWIEAEDRPGKRPGGFCTRFPVSGETRIFLTFSGQPGNVATVAHELGHAYHQFVMEGMPYFAQNYPMNVAETASTLGEMIVADAALRSAAGTAERAALLDDKLQRAVAFFMNIHARFLFETEFYERRRQGLVSAEELNALMQSAQERAFAGALGAYHPHFWASKLHFYITGAPFYNFPYTFGYLFSAGVYARALQAGPEFAGRYVQLLRETGGATVEELALRHLDADLTGADFWQAAADLILADVGEFMRATE